MQSLIREMLRQTAFFRGLSDEACRRLAAVARLKPLRKKEILFQEGRRGEAVFLLERGAVQLFKSAPDGAEVVIRTIRPGEMFAEVVLFEQDAYPVTARAIAASRVLAFPTRDFLALLEESAFRREFIANLMRRQRYLADRLRDLSAYEVDERFFLFLREQFGTATRFELPMAKRDVAAAIGATPETFSRLIARLKRKRLLKWQGRMIELPAGFWALRGG